MSRVGRGTGARPVRGQAPWRRILTVRWIPYVKERSGVPSSARVHHALSIARAQLGDPYRYGAAGPSAFDCSGLTYYSFHRAGFSGPPRTPAVQPRFVRHIPRSHLRPGDLVFFYDSGGVYHVGIFARWQYGHRVIIHAPYPGKRVERERIWTDRWFAGTLR